MKRKGKLKYIVEVYKWSDKINNNTYHAVNITDIKTNKLIISTGLEYGYGEQYKYTAFDELIKMGLFKKENINKHDLIREMFYFSVHEDVLKRDLNKREVV